MAKGQDELKVYVCKDFSIWLCNCSDQDMEVGPQELFGFNTGVYKDALGGRALAWTHDVPKPRLLAKLMFSLFFIVSIFTTAGVARTPQLDNLPWIVPKDTYLVGWKADEKVTPTSVANLICVAAQRHGIMEVSICDHDVVQKTTATSLKGCKHRFSCK